MLFQNDNFKTEIFYVPNDFLIWFFGKPWQENKTSGTPFGPSILPFHIHHFDFWMPNKKTNPDNRRFLQIPQIDHSLIKKVKWMRKKLTQKYLTNAMSRLIKKENLPPSNRISAAATSMIMKMEHNLMTLILNL